jgi:hypothetical protein
VRQHFRLDKLPQAVRETILKARAAGQTWEQTAAAATLAAGELIAVSVCHRWYDVQVEQAQREVMARVERARELAAAFAARGFENLSEATLTALSTEVFSVMEAKSGAARERSLGNLAFVLSRLIEAQARQKSVELEARKVTLSEKRLEELRSKTEKATNEAATKLGKGRQLTVDDINRIRERTFGLPPVKQSAAAGSAT